MEYIVLRDLRRVPAADPFGGGGRDFGTSLAATRPPEPKLDVVELDRRERDELGRDPSVVAIAHPMPVQLIRPLPASEDDVVAAAAASWGIAAVGADRSAYTGAGTVVAVLDTGIDRSHPAFAGMTLVEQDFTGSGDGDRAGHGTHVAGTIFGRDADGMRIGVARGVSRALIGKVLNDEGNGSTFAVLSGMQWALEQGVDVISMSIGFDFPGVVRQWVDVEGWPIELATAVALESYRGNMRMFDALMEMIRAQEVLSTGTVVVAAAGNESRREENPEFEIAASLPAAAEGVLSVGAVGESPAGWAIAPFSNTFPQLCAPGVAITSAAPGGSTRPLSGTSMACPHVAGVAALWWEFARTAGLPPRATSVIAKTLATARLEGFAVPTDVTDRGLGMVTAP